MRTITVYRSLCRADGWADMDTITLSNIPALAYKYAGERKGGPIAPTDEEIIDACKEIYGRVALKGYSNPGDIDVRVEIKHGPA